MEPEQLAPAKATIAGEVSEWPKEQHWKCCMRLKPHRGFESLPLRFVVILVGFTG